MPIRRPDPRLAMKTPPEKRPMSPRSTGNAGNPMLLRCSAKLQREESVIHVVSDRLDDMTARLNTLREHTADGDFPPRRKPPLTLPERVLGYDARDIIITSRNFR
jgi:hypothetical protein